MIRGLIFKFFYTGCIFVCIVLPLILPQKIDLIEEDTWQLDKVLSLRFFIG